MTSMKGEVGMSEFYRLDLTQDEIVQLYGLFERTEVVKIINQAMRDKEHQLPGLLGDIIGVAENSGWLRVKATPITLCKLCDASWGYHTHKRTNSRKGIHKGKLNHDDPIWHPGVEFETIFDQRVFFTMKGFRSGVCKKCWEKHENSFFQMILDNELPIDFGTYAGFKSLFEMQKTLTCFSCEEESLELEFKKLPALMGGYYPGECPKCGAKHLPLRRKFHKSGSRLVKRGNHV